MDSIHKNAKGKLSLDFKNPDTLPFVDSVSRVGLYLIPLSLRTLFQLQKLHSVYLN
jgi:hypothetical protein